MANRNYLDALLGVGFNALWLTPMYRAKAQAAMHAEEIDFKAAERARALESAGLDPNIPDWVYDLAARVRIESRSI